jgi:murein DD-endopeptidase MepM/ murein hydrolase activator NlpD
MKSKRRFTRFLQGLTALLCVVALTAADVTPALAVTQQQINQLKEESKDLTSQKKELQSKLNQLSKDKSQALARKDNLDQQISTTSAQITNVEAQITQYTELIAQAEADLADAQEREAAQYALFCKRVRAMEERGTVSYWSVLFKAESFTDLLGRMDFINEIMESDQRVIDQLQALQVEITEKQESLEASKAEQEEARAELETRKQELDAQRAEANQIIQELTQDANETEAELDDMEAEAAAIQAQITKLTKQWEQEQAALNKTTQSNPGGYIWPVDSRYITSTMGGRSSPGGIGSTNHKGTDIGRVGYTSSVYAAKAGTVIVAQRSSSYGNYVVIAHGTGNTTLYAHMSSIKVSVGQTVQQGAVIGITGSTGNSTGPHLHFEVTENGVRVNPLSDGADPKKGYLTGYTLSGK